MSERVPEDLVQWADHAIDDLVAAGTVAETARRSLNVHLVGAIELGIQRGGALTPAPIPMRLRCPQCNTLHIDEGEFATRPHKTHTCQSCGEHFQPALVPTVGVKFLPGCKDETAVDKMAAHLANCDRCCRSRPFSKDCCDVGQRLWQATRK